jgi:diacylglycerol kinase
MNSSKISDRKILLILLGLIIVLFAHNIYLQTKINKAIDYASDAEWEARQAKDYASNAADYAYDAAENAFGNNCSYCP